MTRCPTPLRPTALLGAALLAPLALLGTGCSELEDIKDTFEGLTESMVVEAIYIGVKPPEGDVIDLSSTEFADGESITVYLADATSVADIESAPVSGADVALVSDGNGGRFVLEEQSDGKYTARGADGLVYTPENVAVTASMADDDNTYRIAVEAPPPADAGLPESHGAGSALSIDISGQGYDSLLITVLDPGSGAVTWTNRPESIEELYEFTRSSDGDSLSVEVPGAAFPDAGIYAVGVAGMYAADSGEMEEVNTGLSTFLAGELEFHALEVRP